MAMNKWIKRAACAALTAGAGLMIAACYGSPYEANNVPESLVKPAVQKKVDPAPVKKELKP